MTLTIPDPALVLLIGPSGAGKSTFGAAHFGPTEVLSSDALRAMVADDPADQNASAEAFGLLAVIVDGRLRRGLMTVVDATNLRATDRTRYRRLASRYGLPTVAIAFDLPVQLYLARNGQRPDRVVDADVVANQAQRMARALAELPAEGYAELYVLSEPDTLGSISLTRQAPA